MSTFHYTSQFDLKLKVQSRQYSIDHPDTHYAAAVFRYVKEFCVKFRDSVVLIHLYVLMTNLQSQ
jgi:hypothetical protein